MANKPDFIVIGAMKCATSTAHVQLGQQPGVFMTEPKEPNFFSDDSQYAQGLDYYQSLFASAKEGDICGESSTHYSKLPTYPHTVARLKQHLPDCKFIYIIRHPIERLISQYIHEWTQRVISCSIDEAIETHPELVAYSQYSMQIKPYLENFSRDQFLFVFFERMAQNPQAEMERICRFIGYHRQSDVIVNDTQENRSSSRMRQSPIRDFFLQIPGLREIRQYLIPQSIRDAVKKRWMINQRPKISPEKLTELEVLFDQDLRQMNDWLNISLSCSSYEKVIQNL